MDQAPPKQRRYATQRVHPSYTVEPCPACDFPEADGGHCPDCGWTKRCGCHYCNRVTRKARR